MKTKICFKCKQEKSVNEFHKCKRSKDELTSYCKECVSSYGKTYYLKNKGIIKNPHRKWAVATLNHHKYKGCIIKIAIDELEQIAKDAKNCFICERKLEYRKKRSFRNPTLDRIHNEKEVRKDNINIICWQCNSSKSNRTMKEFIEYCKMVYEKFEGGY